MYNNNDTITQGRNKAQKQSKDKKLHFKSMAASSFVGAMAGAGAMWAGEAFANEQNNEAAADTATTEAAGVQTIAQPNEQEVTADINFPHRAQRKRKAKRKHSTRPAPHQRPMPQHTTLTTATPHITMSRISLRPLTRKDMPHSTTFKLKVSKP